MKNSCRRFQLPRKATVAAFCLLVSASPSFALSPEVSLHRGPPEPSKAKSPARPTTIKVDVPLVLLSVTVTDPMNRLVTGLGKEHFRVTEDKVPQEITQFGAEDAPLSLGIVFDASGSMGRKLSKAREAVARFSKTANPDDEFFLVLFKDRPELAVDFTRAIGEIQNRLIFAQSKGRTALLDAIYLAINKMKEATHARKALLVVSDGADNSSRYTDRELKRLVRETDVQIYAVGIFEPPHTIDRTFEELQGPRLLTDISESTGGRHFPLENVNHLPDIVAKIGVELRNQYIIGFTPANEAKDGKWRRLKVSIRKIRGVPPLRAYFRLGYYAPAR